MTERVGLSKRTRFEVFKRDGFVCVYCGAHPPQALMECDHVIPVVAGGTNDIENLVTACQDCNRGKGPIELSVLPQSVADKLVEAEEREAQVRAYYEILQARKDRQDEEMWAIANVFMDRFRDDSIQRSRLDSISMFLKRLDYFEVLEAMEIATNRKNSRVPCFSYFCGVCWNKIKSEGQQ
jgi:hypothetical protein